ncbi:uncharacterized protein [Epargyreus clarus]|uniref:uncharacterized protein isoform X2 n=1 Tax=Epargyreus clarus TaxID=520877 RepID=UPI003C2EED5E
MLAKYAIVVLFCMTVNAQEEIGNKSSIGYDPGELLAIFPGNLTQPRAGYGLLKFEDQLRPNQISFEDQTQNPHDVRPFKFENDQYENYQEKYPEENGNTDIKFDSSNQNSLDGVNNVNSGLPGNKPNSGHKKRRRRKPRKQLPGQSGYPNLGYPGPIAPGLRPGPAQGIRPNYFQPGFNGQAYRPPRRPRPSLASDALSAVTGALTSIAENDDYQCVARLLCEAAAGGALGGSSLLESISGLQPLLTLLSAYNGISSNPLFVFGRAAFLGMSSKSNPGSCRYAYPLCPTDPEQLVHYLNNHNRGFFRFFNAPQQGQQNLEQFYNQLSQNGLHQGPNQENYGLLPNPEINQQHYGLLNPGQLQNYGNQPNLYPNGYGYQQNYGLAFPYNQNNGVRFRNDRKINNDNEIGYKRNEDKIQKRIQNKPASFVNDNFVSIEHNSKWLFPGEDDDDNYESDIGVQYVNYDDFKLNDYRKGKTLKFPDESDYNDNIQDYDRKPEDTFNFDNGGLNRKPKGIAFPENVNNGYNNYNKHHINYPLQDYNNDNVVFNNAKRGVRNYVDNQDEPGVTTVYVVRGNGDPNKPEIVKLRPGETL